ncbi:protein kinase domain-containing protein [Mobilicoccus massiliensis]|uniref:protein kinase domain-containing protein n=1 Tax=Mobilicoccus massiliensis TaxID=1522310 RepID=UPI00058F25F2|nr:protein kinase [Mobilicoccus massiliensis]
MNAQLFGGRYHAAALLGAGSCGEVWAAQDDAGEWCAVRVLAADLSGVRESPPAWRALASVRHPHVVTLREVVEEDGRWIVVSDLVEGADLRSQVTVLGTIEPATVARWGAELAGALVALHAVGVAHGDLRLENVLLDAATGSVKASDAGVAGLLGGDANPEVDLYHLGAVLYEVSCGRAPFVLGGGRARLLAVPERPAGLPDELWAVIVELLTGGGDADEVRTRLSGLATSLQGVQAATALPPREAGSSAAESSPRERWRRRVVVAGAAAVAAALLGGGVAAAALFSGGETQAPAAPASKSGTQIEIVPGAGGATRP